ncbi:MAG: outer membrane beta-barrel protein [Acetobacter sp.]|nr:outer membrane beta-barrel protein [Acetobacter sp.]
MTKAIKVILVLISIITFSTTSVYAECDGFYLAGRIGQAKYKLEDGRGSVDSSHSDYIVDKKRLLLSGAIGYRYEHFRAEFEYIWRKKNSKQIAGITTGKFSSPSYMFVVYYDFFPYYWFTPFVNAGIGYTRSKLSFSNSTTDTKYSIKENAFTWSLGAGITAKVTNRFNVDFGYRYYDMGELSVFNGKTDLEDHEIYLGLRYVL